MVTSEQLARLHIGNQWLDALKAACLRGLEMSKRSKVAFRASNH